MSNALRISALFALFLLLAGTAPATIATAQEEEDAFGYFEVVGVSALNIRERPYTNSPVLGIAEEGEVLVKWRRYCSLRPWCPVRMGGIEGWAGKAYLREIELDD